MLFASPLKAVKGVRQTRQLGVRAAMQSPSPAPTSKFPTHRVCPSSAEPQPAAVCRNVGQLRSMARLCVPHPGSLRLGLQRARRAHCQLYGHLLLRHCRRQGVCALLCQLIFNQQQPAVCQLRQQRRQRRNICSGAAGCARFVECTPPLSPSFLPRPTPTTDSQHDAAGHPRLHQPAGVCWDHHLLLSPGQVLHGVGTRRSLAFFLPFAAATSHLPVSFQRAFLPCGSS